MDISQVIVGIDEAGRGPLAGPVVAGACLLIPELIANPLIGDSKKFTEDQREEAFVWISAYCTFGIGISDAKAVDALGILGATEKAMQSALAQVEKIITPNYLLVDGRDKFWFNYPHSSVIKGDEKEPCIGAASILAKVTRDRLMKKYAKEFSVYGFEEHKGYGTPEHFTALKKYGTCTLHRKTFLTKLQETSLSSHSATTETVQ